MKDFSKNKLEEERPSISALEAIQFCLDKLYEDKVKSIEDYVVNDLCFEELIGALLLAKDDVIALSKLK